MQKFVSMYVCLLVFDTKTMVDFADNSTQTIYDLINT